ncbi:stalk domain-containing protein [Paenibacillus alvei]|uniref:stalk domain-containing protein n=1 Tax=Paenibacillus alvei TaxID=44250 RepID=UPI0018CF3422|nr:stalk domain-containing protein [Paenibacillus alvei]MBG9735817.1 copper amine oxidase [Paenibacillus alvei]MBG9743254.1 copper amine oxidase [Paenibacillus alvei]MCY9579284.1 stalk domain-containing protein [Paenibacillus alvei]MCY9585936.1 stalk domain-containing protein [Paenibacillus alvei]
MKKWTYLTSGIVIGALVATAGSAFADQVKSLIGKQVTAEYDVVVNGKSLQDKGAAIDGRANVPVRSLANAIGADIKVEGKKILVTLEKEEKSSAGGSTAPSTNANKYIGGKKKDLEELKNSIENNRIKPAVEEREVVLAEIEKMKKSGTNGEPAPGLAAWEKQLSQYDEIIARANEDLRLVNEALETAK